MLTEKFRDPWAEETADWAWSEEAGGRTPPKIAYDALGFGLDPVEAVRCRFLGVDGSRLVGPIFGTVCIFIGYQRRRHPRIIKPVHQLWVLVSDDEHREARFYREFVSEARLDTSSVETLVAGMRVLLLAQEMGCTI